MALFAGNSEDLNRFTFWCGVFAEDRRLLAYFDEGGIVGSGTFQDRIIDYQQDSQTGCEVETALVQRQTN